MTKKRFKLYEHKDNDYILDNPDEYLDFIEMLGDALTSEEIVDLLNEQHEQINTLRESRRELISANNEYRMRETELAQELSTLVDVNEQLKQSYTKLKHRHGLLHDECLELEIKNDDLKQWQKEVFEVIDEKIKHYEHKPFSAPIGQPMSVNFDADVDRLARLSELQDLEKELKMND